MAVTVYEIAKNVALDAIRTQMGRMELLDATNTVLAEAEIDATSYTIGDIGNANSETLTLGPNVDFDIGAGAVGNTATKLRITTDTADVIIEGNIIDIDLTSSQLFEAQGVYTLTTSTITIT